MYILCYIYRITDELDEIVVTPPCRIALKRANARPCNRHSSQRELLRESVMVI